MLRELKLPSTTNRNTKIDLNRDYKIACNLVDILFRHVLDSIRRDRSTVKLNMLTKGMILGYLGKTRDGTQEYLLGMRSEDIKILLDELTRELTKR